MALMAMVALGACGRDAPRDDRTASSQPRDEAVSQIVPAAPAMADQTPEVEIAEPDGGAKVYPGIGAGILPLVRILAIARARAPGEVIEVELDEEDGRPEYEVKILTADGRSIEMKIDAVTGTIRKSEED
jgi:uncharacterized membrane protein YkoI